MSNFRSISLREGNNKWYLCVGLTLGKQTKKQGGKKQQHSIVCVTGPASTLSDGPADLHHVASNQHDTIIGFNLLMTHTREL